MSDSPAPRHPADAQDLAEGGVGEFLTSMQPLLDRHAEVSKDCFREDYKAGRITADIYMELLKNARQSGRSRLGSWTGPAAERKEMLALQVDLEHGADWYAKLDAWEALALEERQQVLRMLVERIDLTRPKGSKDASVHIRWKLAGPQGQVAAAVERLV